LIVIFNRITALSIMTLSIITLGIMKLALMTHSIRICIYTVAVLLITIKYSLKFKLKLYYAYLSGHMSLHSTGYGKVNNLTLK
jgi:hypothetical protein